MKKILYPILAVAAIFAVSSCEKNLDIPQKGAVGEDDFYQSDADAEALLANMYTTCFGAHGIAGTEGIYNNQLMAFNYSSDDILAAGGDAEDHGDFRVFDEFRYDNANPVIKNLYDGYATSILAANLIISNFTNENRYETAPKYTSDKTEACVAEARVFRAYMHMMMAITWNRPNIVNRLLDKDEFPVQAESQKQVLDWVIAECKKAIDSGHLYKKADKDDKEATTRMTVGFAQFVAGKAAMFNNDPATAREYLGALIADPAYELVSSKDFWKLTHAEGDGNTEVLFAPNVIEDPNFTSNAWGLGMPIQRGRWMVADVLCWRTDAMATTPTVCENLPMGGGGWNGGAIQQDFAKKFLEHDGNSPRRLATFITEDEFFYGMEWSSDKTPEWQDPASKKYHPGAGKYIQKIEDKDGKKDTTFTDDITKDSFRGIKSTTGVYSHDKYFEWKRMVWHNVPKLVAGDEAANAMSDDFGIGANSNISNLCIARLAEVLLLYAEACIGSDKEAEGLAALKKVQVRSGSGKVNEGSYTLQDIMDEKQYELWFEGCRFHDLVRWAAQGKVNLNKVFNESGFHDRIPVVTDKFFTGEADHHEMSVKYVKANYKPFETGKHEYFPFPRDIKTGNPYLEDVLGWK